MKMKFEILFIIVILISAAFLIFLNEKSQPNNFDLDYKSEYYIYNHNLLPTENLKQNFFKGSEICQKKKFYTSVEYEVCAWEYVKNKSQEDYKTLETIRTYCLENTTNEYNRRECIEKVIY